MANFQTGITTRFAAAPWIDTHLDITIVGIGGVGAGVARLLGIQGNHTLQLVDFDVVEIHNCVPQGFKRADVGKHKVKATVQAIKDTVSDSKVSSFATKWEGVEHLLQCPNIIACPDNMALRHRLFNYWLQQENRQFFIDVRLLAEVFEIYFVQQGDEQWYSQYLYSDEEIEEAPCTYRQTAHIASICHGQVVSIVNQYCSEVRGKLPRRVQFFAPLNQFINEYAEDTVPAPVVDTVLSLFPEEGEDSAYVGVAGLIAAATAHAESQG